MSERIRQLPITADDDDILEFNVRDGSRFPKAAVLRNDVSGVREIVVGSTRCVLVSTRDTAVGFTADESYDAVMDRVFGKVQPDEPPRLPDSAYQFARGDRVCLRVPNERGVRVAYIRFRHPSEVKYSVTFDGSLSPYTIVNHSVLPIVGEDALTRYSA